MQMAWHTLENWQPDFLQLLNRILTKRKKPGLRASG